MMHPESDVAVTTIARTLEIYGLAARLKIGTQHRGVKLNLRFWPQADIHGCPLTTSCRHAPATIRGRSRRRSSTPTFYTNLRPPGRV